MCESDPADYFFNVNLAIEKSQSSGFQPLRKDVEIFRPGLSWNNKLIDFGDTVTSFLILLLLYIFFKTLFRKKSSGKLIAHFGSMDFVLQVSFFACEIYY